MSCDFCEKADFGCFRAELDAGGARISLAGGCSRFPKEEQFTYCPLCGEALTEPEPLTLEELREMDGQPVWVKFYEDSYEDDEGDVKIENPSCKIIGGIKPCANGLLNNIIEFTDGMDLNLLYYSSDWIAYRRPPKGAAP